jgi:acyl-CoA synthetase (AMP-forming)/AMP-acid ligase II
VTGALHPLIQAERQPDKTAYLFASDDSPVTVSYALLASRILKGAQLLRKLGLKTGDGIVVVSENHPDLLCLYWAAQICGLYWTAISAQFQHHEIAYILNDCDARLLVTTTTQREKISEPPQPLELSLDDWLKTISAEPETLIADPAEGAEMLYSSGTTGRPKGVRASKPGAPLGTVSELFARRLELHQVDASSVYLSTAPLYHSAPLRYNAMIHRSGGTSIIMPRFAAEPSLALIEAHRITHSQWVPTMFVRLLRLSEQVKQQYDLSSHRFAIHAAAPCPVGIKEQMMDWWGPILYEYYSGTEGNGQTAISPEQWLQHKGSVGLSILGELKIVDNQGDLVAEGVTGMVYFADGPRFEYYKDPEKTASAFNTHGWSTLGDIGHVDTEGYLYLTDRASQMIITGGVNVYPREVEDVLLMHPAIQDAAVFGIPNTEFGESVRAAVELSPDSSATEAELIDYCRSHLAHLKCPRQIDFHTNLPRHQTGKLYKQALREPFWPD